VTDTTVVDFFTWNRDFHGIRRRSTPDARPVKLNAAAHAVACAIAAHINNTTGSATLGIRRISESAQVSTSTAQNAIAALEESGWLHIVRNTRPGTKANATSTYSLVSPVAALSAQVDTEAAEGCIEDRHTLYRESTHPVSGIDTKLRSTTTTPTPRDEDHSVDAVARIVESVDESKSEPAELPADWAPGKFHRSKAERLGIDVDAAGAYFADEMRADGERRRDWGSTFGAFLDEIGAGTVETTFGMRDPQDVAVEASVTAWIADNTPEPAPVEAAHVVEVEHVAPVAAPRRVGYTADVVAGIEWVEGILGRLSDAERVMAGDLLTAGVMRSEVWTEVENARERTAAAA
jgi:hypothetical protein